MLEGPLAAGAARVSGPGSVGRRAVRDALTQLLATCAAEPCEEAVQTMQQVPVVMWCPLISSAQLFLKWVLSHVLVCRYVKNLMEQAGLAIREDPMGNIWGRLAGSEPKAGELTPREGDST